MHRGEEAGHYPRRRVSRPQFRSALQCVLPPASSAEVRLRHPISTIQEATYERGYFVINIVSITVIYRRLLWLLGDVTNLYSKGLNVIFVKLLVTVFSLFLCVYLPSFVLCIALKLTGRKCLTLNHSLYLMHIVEDRGIWCKLLHLCTIAFEWS